MLTALLAAAPSLHARHAVPRASVAESATTRLNCKPYDSSVDWSTAEMPDEKALIERNWASFPLPPEDLINRAKWTISEARLGMVDDSCLAPDFEFCAPFIGPLPKDDYLGALQNFKITEAFPDLNSNFHAFRADPFQPGRVWFNTRAFATHTGKTPLLGAPTGKKLEMPPQSYSLIFNEQGKVREITVGYVVDRRIGNTGGLGGAFGFFYGVGKPLPFPECKPYKPSIQLRVLSLVGSIGKSLKKLFGRNV
ncbi:hypothetical protein AB1Y20_016191 [Prymnesium parvum]|uniref:Uncharacterized protein n=1 Tax=Prymnesium parvum TaxID=97485 RepID=A0AB34IE25_PRYPA